MITIPRLNVGISAQNLISDDNAFNGLPAHVLDCLNWADEFPYRPYVAFRAFHNDSHLFVEYEVNEEYTRAIETRNGHDVYKDSCVEFFVMPEGSSHYYNFEWNAIGTLCMSRRTSRHDPADAPAQVLESVLSSSSYGCMAFAEIHGDNHWKLRVAIPCSALFGDNLESWHGARLKGNFYKCGDELSKPHFITFYPISTASPDYHRPEFFGEIVCG